MKETTFKYEDNIDVTKAYSQTIERVRKDHQTNVISQTFSRSPFHEIIDWKKPSKRSILWFRVLQKEFIKMSNQNSIFCQTPSDILCTHKKSEKINNKINFQIVSFHNSKAHKLSNRKNYKLSADTKNIQNKIKK